MTRSPISRIFSCAIAFCLLALAVVVSARAQDAAIDPEVLKLGRTQYLICSACHGQNGEGGAAGPPLAGSEWVNGPPENLIRIQLRGLRGPITVKGQTHDFPAGMAPLAYQNDAQIAAVLTYVRQSFGNSAPAITPQQVAALRGEVGKPQLTAADLILPDNLATPAEPGKYDALETGSNLTKWIAVALVGLLVCGSLLAIALRGRTKE